MYYTSVKSVELLRFFFFLIHEKASRMNLWRGSEKSRRKGRGRNLSLWEEFLLVLVRNRRGTDLRSVKTSENRRQCLLGQVKQLLRLILQG